MAPTAQYLEHPWVTTVVDALAKPVPPGLTNVEPENAQTYLSFPLYLGLSLVASVIIPLIRVVLKPLVFEPAGRWAMYTSKGEKVPSASDPVHVERMRKWNESAWKMTVFSCTSILAIAVSYQERWFTDTAFFWLGCSEFPPCNLQVKPGPLLFYCVQTGFYIQSIPFLLFIEVRRKDFLESLIHHVVTLGLMLYSFHVNFVRVGVLIMALHDVCDVPMEAAKLARYTKRQTLAMTIFAAFFVTWVVMRCVYFPLVIIRSTLTEPIVLVARVYRISPSPHYEIFNALLLTLLVLHLYWTYLILRIIVRQLRYGDAGDEREKED